MHIFRPSGFLLGLAFCVVLFVFYFMRDLECATAEYADARVDEASEIVVMNMSVS